MQSPHAGVARTPYRKVLRSIHPNEKELILTVPIDIVVTETMPERSNYFSERYDLKPSRDKVQIDSEAS
ncbi:hypothetical protein Plhal304r1_c010g0038551 [Plasmopara halstedii]